MILLFCRYHHIFKKRIWHLIKEKQISFTPVSFVSSLGRICPEVLEKKILKFVNAFLLFCNYLPFEKGLDLHIKEEMFQKHKCPLGAKFKTNTCTYMYKASDSF